MSTQLHCKYAPQGKPPGAETVTAKSFEWIVGSLVVIILSLLAVVMAFVISPETPEKPAAPCPACVCQVAQADLNAAAEKAATRSAAKLLDVFKPRP